MDLNFQVCVQNGEPGISIVGEDICGTEYQQPDSSAWWCSQDFTISEELHTLTFDIRVSAGAQANVQVRPAAEDYAIAAMIITDTGEEVLPFELEFIGRSVPLQIQFRIWKGQGEVVFSNVKIDGIEEDPILQGLPVPPPDITQKHHVTGWKWGNNIALFVHGDQVSPPSFTDDDDNEIPYEIKGFQHGRRLDLDIGNMFIDEQEEEPNVIN